MRELYEDLMTWLAQPGKLSKVCWHETYEIREKLAYVDAGEEAFRCLALCKMIEVASKTARARCSRLPDSLHNMMILNSGGVKPELQILKHLEWRREQMREDSERFIQAYVKMLENLPAQKART